MTILAVSKEDAINVCELGKGVDCCVWLAIGKDGFECLSHERDLPSLIGETLPERLKSATKRLDCDRVRALKT